MSQENVEIARRAFEIYDSYNRGPESFDGATAAFEELITPDFEYREDPRWPGAKVYKGAEEYRKVVADYYEALGEMVFEAEEFIDAGDRVVVFVRFWAKGTGSGAKAEMHQAQVFTIRNGRIARQEVYFNREEALEAAGLEE